MNFAVEKHQFFRTFVRDPLGPDGFPHFVTKIVQFKILNVFLLVQVTNFMNNPRFPVNNPKI